MFSYSCGQPHDSEKSDVFEVHKLDKIFLFHEYKNSFHYHDISNRSIFKLNHEEIDPGNDIVLLNNVIETVDGNMNKFSKQQVEAAIKARKLYGMVGFPSDQDFKNMVRSGMIKNCPITVEDIENATKLFWEEKAVLKGKTVQKLQDKVTMDYVPISTDVLRLHKNADLDINVLYVNKTE
eukprot:12074594-Ditylum_brightwellii.AAC.1